MTTPPVSLADFKAHINVTIDDDDAELWETLVSATEAVEDRCGPMTPVTVTERVTPARNGVVLLTKRPVISITSVEDEYAGVVEVDGFGGNLALGRVDLLSAVRADIEYVAGRDPVPYSLRTATLIVAAHLHETQRGRSGGGLAGIYGAADMDASGQEASRLTLMGFALPRRAMELMKSHLQVSL